MSETELPDQYLYSRKGPWPQPSPSHPLICADEVLHIPPIEALVFQAEIGQRYLAALSGYAPKAAKYAADQEDWIGVSKERLDEIMLNTLYTRFRVKLCPGEMELMKDFFQNEPKILEELESGEWHKYDFTAMDKIKTQAVPGTHCAATKVFIRTGEHKKQSCRIILVGDLFVYRNDRSFGIASLYALQGASYHVLFVVHPALHFPMDSVNAITKTAIPMGHPLFQLFLPHSVYSLALDNGVLESSNSVVNNNAQGTRFDPLTSDAYNLKVLFGAGYTGLGHDQHTEAGHQAVKANAPPPRPVVPHYDPNAYPAFDYMKPQMAGDDYPLFDSYYGKWLADYYNLAFLPFCKVIADHIKVRPDLLDHVKNWARYCSTHVKGFPGPEAIEKKDDTLAKVMAIYTWNASVSHGGDHWSFANQVTAAEKCLRLRRPPPTSRNEDKVSNKKELIFSPNDMQRAALGQYMFFQAWAIHPNLIETEYAFTDRTLLEAAEKFKADLLDVNTKWCQILTELPKTGDPDPWSATTTCQPLVPKPNPLVDPPQTPEELYARTIPQSIQY